MCVCVCVLWIEGSTKAQRLCWPLVVACVDVGSKITPEHQTSLWCCFYSKWQFVEYQESELALSAAHRELSHSPGTSSNPVFRDTQRFSGVGVKSWHGAADENRREQAETPGFSQAPGRHKWFSCHVNHDQKADNSILGGVQEADFKASNGRWPKIRLQSSTVQPHHLSGNTHRQRHMAGPLWQAQLGLETDHAWSISQLRRIHE